MLESLHVHNFALLEDAQVNFLSGFNVFTGETGAGKSILIDAFGLILGNRASIDYLRRGTDSYWVQAVFDISAMQNVQSFLIEHGIETDDELFIKRIVAVNGKSKAYINGVQVPNSILKGLAPMLVDIHGQHENQALLNADTPRILIDTFAYDKIKQPLQDYQDIFRQYLAVKKDLAQLKQNSSQQDILLDRYSWEIKEIKNARLVKDEELELENEAKVLQNSERIINYVSVAHSFLDNENAVLSLLASAKDNLKSAGRYDEKLFDIYERLESAWISVDDCRQELSDYLQESNFNSQRAEEIQSRLDTIYRLQKKYGGSTEAVLQYLLDVEEKYTRLMHIAEVILETENKLQKIEILLIKKAELLSCLRKNVAYELQKLITAQIHDLAMPNAIFEFSFNKAEKYTASGIDEIEFIFSANIGESSNELGKIASGGELSRIALAIKTVMRDKTEVPTMVFDEIDTGVSGITAKKMAEKITSIAVNGQVLCITHLPQIAAFADRHIYISKNSVDGRTFTELIVLNKKQCIAEIARMASGSMSSSGAIANAEELIAYAANIKNGVKNDKKIS